MKIKELRFLFEESTAEKEDPDKFSTGPLGIYKRADVQSAWTNWLQCNAAMNLYKDRENAPS